MPQYVSISSNFLSAEPFGVNWQFLIGWEKCDEYFVKMQNAVINGLDFFLMPENDYKEAIDYCKESKRKNEELKRVVRLNNEGILHENNNRFDLAVELYEENIRNNYPARHSYDRLVVYYHNAKDIINERRVLKRALEVFPNDRVYLGRLISLNGAEPVYPIKACEFNLHEKTTGEKLVGVEREMPEFKFYSTENEPPALPKELLRAHSELKAIFMELLAEAKYQEDIKRFYKAADIYERIIAEKYAFPKPYERLVVIYKKAKLPNDVIRILKQGILFFSELRQSQYDYMEGLARKYKRYDYWQEQIMKGKKITYYFGIFELYNPYP